MDHRIFDRLTRHFGAPRSRRTALRALLSAALLRATTRPAAAGPCDEGKHDFCVRDQCCPGRCFVIEGNACPLCCTGKNIICEDPTTGKSTCCLNKGEDPCDSCGLPENPDTSCQTGITGSYRRR
jgi:hypothetical protein